MSDVDSHISIQQGAEVIRKYVRDLPGTPGVYRMLGGAGDVLYVGKAKSLKRRVVSYTHVQKLPLRLQRMVALTRSMEFVHTHTEVEALLLEANLIKTLKPHFNVLLRDDKSFPYILITGDHDYAQVVKYRGKKSRKGRYFGPFASAGLVNRTINVLQRAFLLRNCSDSVFASRTRPCLQYHIKRCTAPCVGYVSQNEYAEQTDQAKAFLSGESRALQERFTELMQQESAATNFEKAAEYRDRIRALTSIHARQDVNISGLQDADVVALNQAGGRSCIQVFFFRAGQNYGNHAYYPRHVDGEEPENILSSFIAQFYDTKPVPRQVIVSHDVPDRILLEEFLSLKAGASVKITRPQKGQKLRLVEFALDNAKNALQRTLMERQRDEQLLAKVAELFEIEDKIQRIEVYDNSHISGTNMVGGMIVAGPEGFNKKAYRKFNIKKAAASDDYGMMREVLGRRFRGALKGDVEIGGEGWPNILLIDGGQGQYNAVREVLEECGVVDDVVLVAISKGPDRDAGREKFHMCGRPDFQLPERDPVLYYLQKLRDEAHRFAIEAHRGKRSRQIKSSPLDAVPGIGAARKKALLLHFGSGKAVMEAGLSDLEKVDGVSKALALKIYEYFQD